MLPFRNEPPPKTARACRFLDSKANLLNESLLRSLADAKDQEARRQKELSQLQHVSSVPRVCTVRVQSLKPLPR